MQPSPQTADKKTGILLVLLLSLLLNVPGIWFGLPSYEGWAPDEILPAQVQEGVARRFSHDWYQKYPPLHYYELALLEAPPMIYAQLRGLSLEDFSFYSFLILAGRFLSLFMTLGIVFLVYKCGRELFDERPSLFAALIAALLIPLVYYAKTANLDAPFHFWFMVSLLFFLRLLRTRRRTYYLLFALAAVLTLCTKDQAYGLYALSPLVVLWADWKSQKKAASNLTIVRFLKNPNYLYAAAMGLGAFVLLYNLAFNWQGFLDHVRLITGPVSKNYQLFPNTLAGHLHLLGRAFDQIRFSLGWPLFVACVAGVVKSLTAKPKNWLLLSLFSFIIPYDILYIHVIRFNYSRYYLPVCLILSLFGGQFIASVVEARPKFWKVTRAAVAAAFIYSLLYAFSLDVYMLKDSRYQAEKWIRQNVPKEATIGLAVWPVYAPRLRGYQWLLLPLSFEEFKNRPAKPDFVLVNGEFKRRFSPDSREGRFFANFDHGEERYQLAFRYKTPLSWLPLSHREVLAQINTINPEILIYKKITR